MSKNTVRGMTFSHSIQPYMNEARVHQSGYIETGQSIVVRQIQGRSERKYISKNIGVHVQKPKIPYF